MSRTDAVGTSVAATYHQHVFPLGSDALILTKLNACQHAVLLCKQFEGEMYSLQFTARGTEVTRRWRTSGDDDGGKVAG
jgi:hypothetical protein